MNRIIVITIILLITSCQVFKKRGVPNRQLNNLVIHANTSISQNPIKGLRIKTKINIFRDSIVATASPVLGIEVFKLRITNDTIYVENKLQNTKDSLVASDMDPRFKLKTIKKLLLNSKPRRDTMSYNNSYMTSLFTDYVNKQDLFLPQKIIFWKNDSTKVTPFKQSINIDYKLIKYYKNE